MKKQLGALFLLFSLLTFLPLTARDYKTVEGDITKTRIYTLDNGLKVYLSVAGDNKEDAHFNEEQIKITIESLVKYS